MPVAPALDLPEPYFVIDFAELRTHGSGPKLTIRAEMIASSVLVEASITNLTRRPILVPPISEHMFDFDFWEQTSRGKLHALKAYERRFAVLERRLEKEDLIPLGPGLTLSINVAIPNVPFASSSKPIYVQGYISRWASIDGKDIEFSLVSAKVRLIVSRKVGTKKRGLAR